MVEPSTAISSSTSLPLELVGRDATGLLSSRITALSNSLRFPTLFQVPRSSGAGDSFPVVLEMASGFEGIRVPGPEPYIFVLAIPTQHQIESVSGFSENSAASPTGKLSPATADERGNVFPSAMEERSELHSGQTPVSPSSSSASPTGPSALEMFRRKNPDFGSAKSPKSYWLRRHSDSVLDASLTATMTSVGKTDDRSVSMTTSADYDNPLNHNRTASESCFMDSWDTKPVGLASRTLDRKPESLVHDRYQSSAVDLSMPSDFNDEVFEEDDDDKFSTMSQNGSTSARASGGELVDIAEEDSGEETGSWKSGKAEMSDEEMYVRDVASRRMMSESGIKLETMEVEISHGGEFQSSSPPHRDWPFKMTPVGIPASSDICPPRRVQRRQKKVAADATPADAGSTKNHRCPVCRRAFSRSDMLERHARLHTGLRPYACRLCTQVFSRSDHLTTHLRTHTGEKPYSCPRCSYSASRRDMVTRHLRVHSGSVGSEDNIPVGCALGPTRRRVYRTRYRSRPTPTTDPMSSTTSTLSPPTLPLPSGDHSPPTPFSWTVPKSDHKQIVSGPASETLVNRRWSKARLLAGLDISELSLDQHQRDIVLARGSTGSTDSYCSPSIVGGSASSEVFEFDGILSPDVFRSPGSARLVSRFLWPFPPPTSTTADSLSS